MKFIPVTISALLNHTLFLLIFLLLAVRSMQSYRSAFTERKEALRELYEDAGKHPIRLEFARHIVGPEMEKIFELKNKLASEKRELQVKLRGVTQREEKVQERLQRIEILQKKIQEDNAPLNKKTIDLKEREHQLIQKEKTIQNKASEHEESKKRYQEREQKLRERLQQIEVKETQLQKRL